VINFPFSNKLRYIPASNTFNAPFTGEYNFSIAANTRQSVIGLQANSIYIIDSYSLGGNIAKEDFLSSIAVNPAMILSRKADKQGIYTRAIPLNHFYENREAMVYFESKIRGDELLVSFSGKLNQTANLVGINPLKISLAFTIYAIDDTAFAANFIAEQKIRRI
jgi:hypothetical protein